MHSIILPSIVPLDTLISRLVDSEQVHVENEKDQHEYVYEGDAKCVKAEGAENEYVDFSIIVLFFWLI